MITFNIFSLLYTTLILLGKCSSDGDGVTMDSGSVAPYGVCGGIKTASIGKRQKRYPNIPFKSDEITWTLSKTDYPKRNLTFTQTLEALRSAFSWWQMQVPYLKFTEVDSNYENPNIYIGFYDRRHRTDRCPFGTDLAHLYHAADGRDEIHLHMALNWTQYRTAPHEYPIYNIAIHEIGHALGLNHSNEITSVMYRTFTKFPVRIATSMLDDLKKMYEKQLEKWYSHGRAAPTMTPEKHRSQADMNERNHHYGPTTTTIPATTRYREVYYHNNTQSTMATPKWTDRNSYYVTKSREAYNYPSPPTSTTISPIRTKQFQEGYLILSSKNTKSRGKFKCFTT